MGKFTDLTGERFGRFTVIGKTTPYIDKNGKKHLKWLCKCDCGKEAIVSSWNLTHGKSKSCGCLRNEITIQRFTQHGLSKTRLYLSYRAMLDRCYDDKHCKVYKHYGGRGINVCEEWRGENGLENFISWALSNGYSDELTIDRIDVNGNYCPNNCRWITKHEQQFNRRNNHFMTIDGETKTVREWADMYGIRHNTILSRLKCGWTEEDSVKRPVDKRRGKRREKTASNGERKNDYRSA